MTALLEVRGLSVGFPTRGGLVEAVSGVSFTLERGRVVLAQVAPQHATACHLYD